MRLKYDYYRTFASNFPDDILSLNCYKKENKCNTGLIGKSSKCHKEITAFVIYKRV